MLSASLLAFATYLPAAQSKVLLSSNQNLWQGFPDGVKVSGEGVLSQGPAFGKAVELPALPLCAVREGTSVFVGTAPAGDLLRVEGDKVSVLHHFDEPLVTALAAGKDGRLFVGTSTPAKVYLLDASTGRATLLAAPKAEYIWALVPEATSVLAATGTPGKVLRIPEKGEADTVLDPGATHVRCLLPAGAALWAGTSGPASLYRIEGAKALLVASVKQEEIASLALCKEGLLLAANEKADQSAFASSKGTKPSGAAVLYLMKPGRTPVQVEDFQTPVLALSSWGEGCAAGLGDGRLFLLSKEELYLSANWDGAPLSALLSASEGLMAFTAGPNALYGASEATARSYAAPVADLGSPARLGKSGTMGPGGGLWLRAGNAAKPNSFWTPWVKAEDTGSLPPSQFAQWKVTLDPGAEVRSVSVAYRPENRPPVFKSAEVRAPGEVSVRMPSQLGDHLVREVHEKETAFPGMAQSLGQDIPPQTFYMQGFRMVTWKTEDPDGDEVRVKVEFRPENGSAWYTLAEHVSDNYYVFDARSMPDGPYRLRLTADDALSNPEGDAAQTTQDLPDFLVDNTAPRLTLSAGGPGRLLVTAEDGTAVQSVRASIDGEPWKVVTPQGWNPGSRKVETSVEYPAQGAHWITVQAVDPFKNMSTAAWLTGEAGK